MYLLNHVYTNINYKWTPREVIEVYILLIIIRELALDNINQICNIIFLVFLYIVYYVLNKHKITTINLIRYLNTI